MFLSMSTERLNDQHPDRIRFFLSKADTAGVESDRQVGISTMLRECSLGICVGPTCTSVRRLKCKLRECALSNLIVVHRCL